MESFNIGDINEVRLGLCYFNVSGAAQYSTEFIDHLVIHSLAALDSGGRPVSQIHKKLQQLTHIQIEYSQTLAALERLQEKNIVYSPTKGDNDFESKFGLTPTEMNKFRKQLREQQEFEQGVIEKWIREVETTFPQLKTKDLIDIKEDLLTFSKHVYSLHTVESVSLFFGDNDDLNYIAQKYDDIRLRDILPERPREVHEIRVKVLPQFFRQADGDRKKYIADHLNPIFALKMLELDPNNAKIISEQFIEGGKLFLDTNVLYPLFGLEGADLQTATKRLIALSRGLNFEPVVSPFTMDEYRNSILTRQKYAKYAPPIPSEIAKAALEVVSTRSIERTLWEKSLEAKGRLSPEEYFSLFTNIDILLKEHGIRVEKNRHKHIMGNDAILADEEQKLIDALNWQNYAGEPSIIQHDVYHRLLILDLRQGYEGATPLQTSHWFLTNDTKLPVYDRRVRQREVRQHNLKIPFCASTTHWMQMLAPYRGAVDGFHIAQAGQLDSPLFRLFRSPEPSMVQNIITRMRVIDKFEPETIADLIKDESFLRDFSQAATEEERNEIYSTRLNLEFEKIREEKQSLEDLVSTLQNSVQKLQEDSQLRQLEVDDISLKKNQADELLNEAFSEIDKLTQKVNEFGNQKTAPESVLPTVGEVEKLYSQIKDLESELSNIKEKQVTVSPVVHVIDLNQKSGPSERELTLANENQKLTTELEDIKRIIKYARYVTAIILFFAMIAFLFAFTQNPDLFPWLRDQDSRDGLLFGLLLTSSGLCILIADDRYQKGAVGSIIIGVIASVIASIVTMINNTPK